MPRAKKIHHCDIISTKLNTAIAANLRQQKQLQRHPQSKRCTLAVVAAAADPYPSWWKWRRCCCCAPARLGIEQKVAVPVCGLSVDENVNTVEV